MHSLYLRLYRRLTLNHTQYRIIIYYFLMQVEARRSNSHNKIACLKQIRLLVSIGRILNDNWSHSCICAIQSLFLVTQALRTIYIAPTNKLIRQSVIISLRISREYNLQVWFDVIFHFHFSSPVINNSSKSLFRSDTTILERFRIFVIHSVWCWLL